MTTTAPPRPPVEPVGGTGRTVLPTRPAHPAPPRVAGLGRRTADEKFTIWGSWAAAAALAWVLCQQVLALPGITWFLVASGSPSGCWSAR